VALGEAPYITDWAGKRPGAAVRLAGVLHVAERAPEAPELEPVSARARPLRWSWPRFFLVTPWPRLT